MGKVYKKVPGRIYGFIDLSNRSGKPFAPLHEWLGDAYYDYCGDLIELSEENPYWALGETSGTTLCVTEEDPGDMLVPLGAFRIVQAVDATDMLFRYARRVALVAARRWDLPPTMHEFLVSGKLTAASALLSSELIVGKESRRARRVREPGELDARDAAQMIALGALIAYTDIGHPSRNKVASQLGEAIYLADASVGNTDAKRQFTDFVLGELAEEAALDAEFDET